MTRRVAIIFNPMAGLVRADRKVRWAAYVLREHGWEVSVRPTRRPGQMRELAVQAAHEGMDAIFAAGGDGTVGAAAEALGGSEALLGVLPLGTANIWAADLGVPLKLNSEMDVRACVEAQLNGTLHKVDMGRSGQRKFLLWAGVGLDAHVVGRVEPRPEIGKRFGVIFYYIAGLLAATGFRGGPMTIRTERETISGTKMMALICNVGRYAGTDSILDPNSKPDDGLFEVWTLEGESLFDGLSNLIRLKTGKHHNHPDIHRLLARQVDIEIGKRMPVQFDGEKWADISQASFEMLPGHLNIFRPK